ncbi:MAG TPA: hypothetical protein VKU90_04760 [Caulobacteraceae bacterium]|nr:hypothetical protein [Caulobacteraceae bacterium]
MAPIPMLRRAAPPLFATLLLAACTTGAEAPYPPPPPNPPPPPATGAIEGHGAFRLTSGARVSCAGFSVALMPDLPRYRRRIQALYGSTARIELPVSEVRARSAQLPAAPDTAPIASASCDPRGEFGFPNLIGGGYFLIAHVKVRPAAPGRDDYVILAPVDVIPGQAADVSLAP